MLTGLNNKDFPYFRKSLDESKVYPDTTHSPSNSFVLVVDDSTDSAHVLTLLLRQQGYTALAVGSGSEARRVLEKILPAVVILDVMMPELDGLEVLQWIRAHDSLARLPVLMYSADQSPETERKAMLCGAQGFLVKGRTAFSELLGAVGKHALARQRAPEGED